MLNRSLAILVPVLAVTILASGCGQGTSTQPAHTIHDVTIDGGDRTIFVGDSATLSATVTASDDSDTDVHWTSSDPATVPVQTDGTIIGEAAGTALVTATSAVDTRKGDAITVTVEPAPTAPGQPTSLAFSDGLGQTAAVATALPDRPAVIVKDAEGTPLQDIDVTFSVPSGGGSISPTTPVRTDAEGTATLTDWTLGTVAGPQHLNASIPVGDHTIEATLVATAEPGRADPRTSTITADETTLPADDTSTSRLTVQLLDSYGNALARSGGSLTVTVEAENGFVSNVTDNTDGSYSATYTAGSTPGDVTLTPSLAGQPFPEPLVMRLSIVSIARISVDENAGPAPFTVHLDAGASDAEDDPAVTYEWNLGDGTSTSGIDVQHSYTEPGRYAVTLTVTAPGQAPSVATTEIVAEGIRALGNSVYAHGLGTSAVLLPSGDVFIVDTGNRDASTITETYEPATETFTAGPSGAVTRGSHSSVLLSDGKVLVFGGNATTLEIFDPSTGSVETVAGPSSLRYGGQAFLQDNGSILVFTPAIWCGQDALAVEYDPSTGAASTLANLGDRFDYTAVRSSDGHYFLVGGVNWYPCHTGAQAGSVTTTVSRYAFNTLSTVGTMSVERARPAVITMPNGLTAIFGTTESPDIIEPTTSLVREVDAIGEIRSLAATSRIGTDKVLVMGRGEEGTIEVFDPQDETFDRIGSFEKERYGFPMVTLPSGDVLVIGGRTNPKTAFPDAHIVVSE